MKIPIELKLDGKPVAQITSFGYETPWASGAVEFIDKKLFERLINVSSMSTFDLEMDELGLEDEEEEKLWEAKLTELNLTWDDLKLKRDGRWVVTPEGSESQPIYSPKFYENGSMDWRL